MTGRAKQFATRRHDGALIVRVSDPAAPSGRRSRIVTRGVREDGRPETPPQHRKRAEAVLAELRAEVAKAPTLRESWTVERWATERYVPSLVTAGRKPATIDGYVTVLATYVYPTLGAIELGRLTVDHVDAHDQALAARGLSPATRRHARGALSRVLRHAKSKRRVARVVSVDADKIERIGRRDRTRGVLEPDEVRSLLTAARSTEGGRWEAPVALLGTLGLRRGEVLALSWDALSLDAGTVAIARNLVPLSGGRLSLGAPKTDASSDTLELSAALVALLRARRADQAADRLAAGPKWAEDMADTNGERVALVFTDDVGRPIPPHRLTAAVTRIASAAGIARKVTPHALRHGYASLLLAEGHDIAAVSASLRHASPAVTAAVYSHAMKRTRVAATAAMAEAVGAW